jgi:phosphoglycerate dehydrogenase-like enzyme
VTEASRTDRLTVLIASYLEPDLVERIAAAAPERIRVINAPELLPAPRYVADHGGIRRNLAPADVERWRALLAEADVLFDFDWLEADRLPTNAPRVRWVQATSSGIGEFLAHERLLEWPITFTTASGVHAVPLAEFATLGLLLLTKQVPDLLAWQGAHHWQRYTSRQLAGQRALVVGLGSVGRRVAEVLAHLGLEVWGVKRTASGTPPRGVRRIVGRAELDDALARTDALILACPYTPETHHLIGAAEFARLPAGAILVNVARGSVVDEPTMVEALRSGHLAGAVLDVFEEEPLPASSPLWEMPNVLISPHSASTVAMENSLITDLFIDNLRRFLDGRPMRNVFDRSRAY